MPSAGEQLALALWVRRPGGDGFGDLELWGQSNAAHNEESFNYFVVPINEDSASRFPAVRACLDGNVRNLPESPRWAYSKWKSIHAYPIVLQGPPHHRLLVGAITLASNKLLSDSSFSRAEHQTKRRLGELISKTGTEILTPRPAA